MRVIAFIALVLPMLVGVSGCRTGRYELTEPLNGQTIEVKSGDRISVVLQENEKTGFVWMAECDDTDISFARETIPPPEDEKTPIGTPGKVRIIIRVARGFDGPAHVKLLNRRPWKGGETARQIDLILYHTAEDISPWRQYY